MLKKKILVMVLATTIFTGAISGFNTTKARAVGIDIVKTASQIVELFGIPALRDLSNKQRANAGHDTESMYFISPNFNEGKFSISAFNYFDKNGADTIFKVKAYSSSDPNNPREYNLKSGDIIDIDTGVDSPEYILEFYKNGETQPFENYYLSREVKNKNYGIALAQNNNVYYLKKETGTVYNEDFIEKLTKYDPHKVFQRYTLEEYSQAAINHYGQNTRKLVYRQSKKVSEVDISESQYIDDSKVRELLEQWKQNISMMGDQQTYLRRLTQDAVMILFGYTNNIPISSVSANKNITLRNNNIYNVDNYTIGIRPNGYVTYRMPVYKDGNYKIKVEMEGEGRIDTKVYGYYELLDGRESVTRVSANSYLTDESTNTHYYNVSTRAGVGEIKLVNTSTSDIKFKSITLEYVGE